VWRGSLHAGAARLAGKGIARAAFDGRRIAGASEQATAGAEGARLQFVTTDGKRHAAAMVLGGRTIEQYLVASSGGRLQAFPLAWDPVAKEWFDVFPDAPSPADWTYWRNPGATANAQCLECHVTGYVKGYDPTTDRYDSVWTELGVGCEACHGAGRDHVVARREAGGRDPYDTPRSPEYDMQACAPCHALRTAIADGFEPSGTLLDHFDLELLEPGTYYADGLVAGEAYEWTSFRMSRMARAGVVCQDCHEPHGATLRADGDALCLRCHPASLAEAAHTRHDTTSAGARCVACHMPESVFMERDARRDHSFTRPDPARSRAIGAPDACTACHADRDRGWAVETVRQWSGGGTDALKAQRGLAVLLEAGRRGAREVAEPLARLLTSDVDDVRRASVARYLEAMTGVPGVPEALTEATRDGSPLVRAAALRTLGTGLLTDTTRAAVVAACRDARRLVRIEAAFALRTIDPTTLDPANREAVKAATVEWLAAQEVVADAPEAHFNQGVFWTARGELRKAESAYRRAMVAWPSDVAPRLNLAMLLLDAGRPSEAETELRAGLAVRPDWPAGLFAQGLVAIRQGRSDAAVDAFEACLRAAPTYPRAALRLAEVLRTRGDADAMERALERATIEPSSRRLALRELVRLAYLRKDEAAVRRWLPEALLSDPDTAEHPDVLKALEDMVPDFDER
jgi:predicted CXXCH cytochrome family protein